MQRPEFYRAKEVQIVKFMSCKKSDETSLRNYFFLEKFLTFCIVCSPPWIQGGNDFWENFLQEGEQDFWKARGGKLQEGESRFPNHLVEELSKNQKLIHETSCFKQFKTIFRSKSQNLWRYAPFLTQIGCSSLCHGINITKMTHTPRPPL